MRYLVARVKKEVDWDGMDASTCRAEADCAAISICEDTRGVAQVIAAIQRDGDDWSLFEVVGGRCERRAAVMKTDGPVLYDVVVS